jgi:outer membrane protein TolC
MWQALRLWQMRQHLSLQRFDNEATRAQVREARAAIERSRLLLEKHRPSQR